MLGAKLGNLRWLTCISTSAKMWQLDNDNNQKLGVQVYTAMEKNGACRNER